MPIQTPNLDLYKVNGETDGNDTFNVDVVLNDNWDKIDAAVGDVGTEIEGLKQSGVDGKNRLETAIIAKEGTVSKQGQVATFEELDNGIHSIPTGTDTSDATAIAADILSNKTAYGPNGKITGTIPVLTGNRTATGVAKWPDGALAVYPEKGYQKGGAGDGEIKVTPAQLQAAEAALRSDNIKSGTSIFGVSGKNTVVDTADAVLDPQYLLVGQSGYDDGVKKAGQMPNRSAENHHMPGLEATVWAGDRFFIRPPGGFYTGESWVTTLVPGLTAANLRKDVNVAGLIGTLVEGRKFIQGSVTPNANGYYVIPVNGFTPTFGFMWQGNATGDNAINSLYMGTMPKNPDGSPNLSAESGPALVLSENVPTHISYGFTQPNNVFFPGSVFLRTGGKFVGTAKYILFE
ncbi:hypothetical protein [Paenibacillus sp. BR1-192]|uniref:hypothetical protein n=1 Tax=Paenibacillus sp. BR1-192 TaxID=3032287 RepID=UPI00240E87AF|nr:hypothetical protein [Paenibacillus sp. BR1-192]WFB60588.1 hypothetical protein P0X86_10445 [Paenibacillus sp. BR1-192]